MDFRPTTIESNQRQWPDALVLVLLPFALVLLPIGWLIYFVRRFYWLRAYGFWVTQTGRDEIEYQELHDGSVDRITIFGERLVSAPHVVYVPSPEEWQQTMLSWARGRREEIIENMKRKLGTKKYEYDYSS